MTVSLKIATITESIAALSIAGADIVDLDQIPETIDERKPLIFPRPDGFITDLDVIRKSFGTGAVAKTDVEYTMNYRLCYASVGLGRGLFGAYPEMVDVAVRFMDAIITNDAVTGLVDLELAEALNFGPVADPAGNMFHGCDFALRILEFQN